MVFAGPSGHGKTELARQMGDLLGVPHVLVDCTEMQHETDLFGLKAPYQGHEKGSPLNNRRASYSGGRNIVFLDEFENMDGDVRQSLLLLLDRGTYNDRRSRTTLNCAVALGVPTCRRRL